MSSRTAPRQPRPAWIRAGVAAVCVVAGMLCGYGWLTCSLLCLYAGIHAALRILRLRTASDAAAGDGEEGARRRLAWITTGACGLVSLLLTVMIPPFQSPDASTHMWRAYALLEGDVLLSRATKEHPENQSVDPALRIYSRTWAKSLAQQREARVTPELERRTAAIAWSGERIPVYSAAAIYFPALYAPAALALGAGRALDAPVATAVSWARLAMLATALALIWLALRCTRAGLATMCVVALLPMSLSLFGSANLDAMTIPSALLVSALMTCGAYGRVSADGLDVPWTARLGAWSLLVLLILAKPVFLVFLCWPVVAALRGDARRTLPPIAATLALFAVWQIHVAQRYHEPRMALTGTPLAKLLQTLSSPAEFMTTLVTTWDRFHAAYWTSLIGNLGWLDVPLSRDAYLLCSAVLMAALTIDVVRRNPLAAADRAVLGVLAVGYVLSVFVLLWVAWTPPGRHYISGVQGRYFLPVVPALAMLLGRATAETRRSVRATRAATALVAAFAIWLTAYLPVVLLHRYWL